VYVHRAVKSILNAAELTLLLDVVSVFQFPVYIWFANRSNLEFLLLLVIVWVRELLET